MGLREFASVSYLLLLGYLIFEFWSFRKMSNSLRLEIYLKHERDTATKTEIISLIAHIVLWIACLLLPLYLTGRWILEPFSSYFHENSSLEYAAFASAIFPAIVLGLKIDETKRRVA